MIKKIEALIKPSDLSEIKQVLQGVTLISLSIITAKTFDAQAQHIEFYRGTQYIDKFPPRLKLEIFTEDKHLSGAINALRNVVGAGTLGETSIFISSTEGPVRLGADEADLHNHNITSQFVT